MIRISKSTWQLILSGLGLYLIFLVYQLPASVAWQWMPGDLSEQVKLQGISGSVWSGKVRNLVVRQQSYGQFQWRMMPWDLLGDTSLYARLRNKDAKLSGDFSISNAKAFSSSDLDIELAAQALQSFTQPLTPKGQIRASINELEFDQGKVLAIRGEAKWHNAGLQSMPSLPLGEISLSAEPEKTGSKISISNKNSPLEIKGNIRVEGNGSYKTTISLLNRNPKQEELSSLLALLGKADTTGRVHIKKSGQLRFR